MTTRLDYVTRGAAIAGAAIGVAAATRQATRHLRRRWLERPYE